LIPKAFLHALLARLDIIEVVGRHLPLKKGGVNYFACCPFHGESTPSFSVSPAKQFYHCFGCSAHGNAIDFVMNHLGLSFVEAVHDLARFAGMSVPHEEGEVSAGPNLAPFLDLMSRAAEFYQYCLGQAPAAHRYLHGRGLSVDVVTRFSIGYAPPRWDALKALVDTYPHPLLRDTGLTIENSEGRTYDRFRNRILFPIWNRRGQVIAFGGRLLEESGKNSPKYLNSPETVLFEKGRELYGWHLARAAVQKTGTVLVVEGYMDVVSLAQFGIENAVATLGTATTPLHLQSLIRQSPRVVFCFDGDVAGRKAAARALNTAIDLLGDDTRLCFLFLPEGEDPDAFVRRKGAAAFEQAMAQATPFSAFFIDSLREGLDLDRPDDRARFLHQAQAWVKRIKGPMLRLQLIQELARLTQTPLQALEHAWQLPALTPTTPALVPAPHTDTVHGTRHTPAEYTVAPASHPPPPLARPPSGTPALPARPLDTRRKGRRHPLTPSQTGGVCALLLRLVLANPAFASRIPPDLVPTQGPHGNALVRIIDAMSVGEIGTQLPVSALLEHFRDTPHEATLANTLAENDEDALIPDQFEALFHDALIRLHSDALKREIDTLLVLQRSEQLDEAGRKTLARLLQERQETAKLVGALGK
jgi:DNA primase